jgi:hypothetical protein
MIRNIIATIVFAVLSILSVAAQCPNNEVWYTTNDGKKADIYCYVNQDNRVISHTFGNGKGVIKMETDLVDLNISFKYCRNLSTVTLPGSLESISYSSFENCSSLESVNIPTGVTTIAESAFAGCASLKDITIPSGVQKIPIMAFAKCVSLTSVEIPEGVTSIDVAAFEGCTGLTSVQLPSTLTSIENRAFARCTSLSEVTIPSSVTTVGCAFSGCTQLESINGKFASSDGRCLVVNNELVAVAPSGITQLSVPRSVRKIRLGAVKGCVNLRGFNSIFASSDGDIN